MNGPNAGICVANHSTHFPRRSQRGHLGKPIRIGKNVWQVCDVKILQSVHIGCGDVIRKDIASNAIVAGNPCRILRTIMGANKTGYGPNKQ